MLVAVVGSRKAPANAVELICENMPSYATGIVSGGAVGIDTAAKEAANRLGLPIEEFLPDYAQYGKRAPLVRNERIIERADLVLAFWDGQSHGTRHVIAECLNRGKRVIYIPLEDKGDA